MITAITLFQEVQDGWSGASTGAAFLGLVLVIALFIAFLKSR